MKKKSETIADDYTIEIEQALEKVMKTPVGTNSIDAIVIDAAVPDTVEQLLEYTKHATSTEYKPDLKIYEDSEEVSHNYHYQNENVSETVSTDTAQTASYTMTIQENVTLQKAESVIANAITQNTFGISDASFNLSVDDQERIKTFKEQNQQEWFYMYQNASWLVTSF